MKLNHIFEVKPFEIKFSSSCAVAGQDYDIKELLERFSNGQRLKVNQRPINELLEGDQDETLDYDSPILDDPVDAEIYLQQAKRRKELLKKPKHHNHSDQQNQSDQQKQAE